MKRSPRSRFLPHDNAAYFRAIRSYDKVPLPINEQAHQELHATETLIHTMSSADDGTEGTALTFWRGGSIANIAVDCAAAPSGGDLSIDVLVDGKSIFYGGAVPKVPDGETFGELSFPDGVTVPDRSNVQVVIDTGNGATGPVHTVFEIQRYDV